MRWRPKFSVIIPTYNRIEFIRRTLDSVWAQALTDYEVIVVDDGSTDGTMEYLQSVEQVIKVYHQPNEGPGSARNLGTQHANGAYLAFLDSDDLLFPWSLEVYQDVIKGCNEPSFIAGKPCRFGCDHELEEVACGPVQSECFVDYLASSDQWRWWGVSSFVIRRDAFVAAGGFTGDRVNGEDADLALRLGVAPGFVQITAPATFAYREHPGSAVTDMERTLAGAWSQVRAEKAGHYPGGKMRARERREILTRHTRPVTLDGLRNGFRRKAWELYFSTFTLNASVGRMRYLAAFPCVALAQELSGGKTIRSWVESR